MHRNIRTFRNKWRIGILAAVISLAACSTKEKAPISRDEMTSILMDIHFAEAYSGLIVTDSTQKNKINKNTDSLAVFYKDILTKHHTTFSQFTEAIKWYNLHPQQLDSVYGKIVPIFDSIKSIPAKKL